MNYCFLMGKVKTVPELGFVINRKCKAACICEIEVDGNNIETRGYERIADFMYRNVEVGDNVAIIGMLSNNYCGDPTCVAAQEIYLFKEN